MLNESESTMKGFFFYQNTYFFCRTKHINWNWKQSNVIQNNKWKWNWRNQCIYTNTMLSLWTSPNVAAQLTAARWRRQREPRREPWMLCHTFQLPYIHMHTVYFCYNENLLLEHSIAAYTYTHHTCTLCNQTKRISNTIYMYVRSFFISLFVSPAWNSEEKKSRIVFKMTISHRQ